MYKVKWLVQGTHLKSGDYLSIGPLLAVIHAYLPVGPVGEVVWKFGLLSPFFRIVIGIVTSWPIQGHSCDMHSPLSLEMLLSLTWQILAPYTINHCPLCGFVAALGFGFSLPASKYQVMRRMNIQTLIVDLSWAAFTDVSGHSLVGIQPNPYWVQSGCTVCFYLCQGYHNSEQRLHIDSFILRTYSILPGFNSLLYHLLAMRTWAS